jgi:hypothetical protein
MSSKIIVTKDRIIEVPGFWEREGWKPAFRMTVTMVPVMLAACVMVCAIVLPEIIAKAVHPLVFQIFLGIGVLFLTAFWMYWVFQPLEQRQKELRRMDKR